MNSVEDGIRFLEKEQELMQSIERVETEHHQLLDEFSSLFVNMREVLKDSFISLGIRADLLKEDENALNDVVESFEQVFTNKSKTYRTSARTYLTFSSRKKAFNFSLFF